MSKFEEVPMTELFPVIHEIIARLRRYDANGAIPAADLLDAACDILETLGNRSFSQDSLSNADVLRLLALKLHGG